jgi:hypothetical protein
MKSLEMLSQPEADIELLLPWLFAKDEVGSPDAYKVTLLRF